MRGWPGVVMAAIAIYFAAALQQGVGLRWNLLGGHADFLLLAIALLCLYTHRAGGALIGFAAGAVFGALDGANMWQYVLTRSLTGFLVSWLAEGGIDRNMFSALLAGVFTVVVAQVTLMFLAPPAQVMPFLGDTIRTAVYNGVLAMLLYAVFNRILGPRK